MWTIHLSFVFGFMVGFEIMDHNETEGITGLRIDLGIFRVMILKDNGNNCERKATST